MIRTNQEHDGGQNAHHRQARLSGTARSRRVARSGQGVYVQAFDWSFTDYGPTYSAFSEGLDGGFDGTPETRVEKPLPVLYSDNLEETLTAVEAAGGRIVRPIFDFPGGRRFHFTDPAGNEIAVWSEN